MAAIAPPGVVRVRDPRSSQDEGGEAINADATSEARVMRLKGYGNSLTAEAAVAFVQVCMEVIDEGAIQEAPSQPQKDRRTSVCDGEALGSCA
jgi:hypothetical protein